MQAVVKFLFTLFTAVSVFCSNLFFPAVINPESENFDFSFLKYPDEAIVTLEEAGLSEQELVGRASAELPEYVQSGGYDDINGITICKNEHPIPKLMFNIGKYCKVVSD
jgi:hypothetical protein